MSFLECLEQDYTLSLKEGWFARVEAPARPRPATLTKAAIGRLGGTERLQYEEERSVWHANLGPILTPQMDTVVAELDEIIESNRQDGDKVKSSALLDAYPGLGKTTLAVMFAVGFHRRHLALYGPSTAEGHQRVPVAYIGLTSNTSMRSLNSMLCRFYGHPGGERGNATQLANRAADCVSSCKTRLIVVDDVHFLDMNRRDGREVANHFKWLSNQFPVTFVFVGVGLRQRHLLNEGLTAGDRQFAQTARRWTRLTLSPFEIGTEQGAPGLAPAAAGHRARPGPGRRPTGRPGPRARRLPLHPLHRPLRVAHDLHHPRLPPGHHQRRGAAERGSSRRHPQRRGRRGGPQRTTGCE